MSLTKKSEPGKIPLDRHGRPKPPSKTGKTLGMLLCLAIIIFAFVQVDARWERLPDFITESPQYFQLMSQGLFNNPFIEPTDRFWTQALRAMFESLQMAWIGTLIGAALSFPISFLAASNIAPKPVVFVTRQILNVIRAIPELILAVAVMMPIFGPGPLAGAIALGIGSIGTLGKLSSEVIESIQPGPVESVESSGAKRAQVLRWAIVPQVLPEIVAFWLYRFEINIRAGAILGVLGAGGVGTLLSQLFGQRLWERIGITLIVIIVVTMIIDQISGRIRARIISGDPNAKLVTSEADAA